MKMNKSAYLFAAALVASTMGMTSCSNEVVPEVENNPTFDGESVKTQFALNIPAGKSTRMSAANTQQESNPFLGMQNIKLLPMFTEPTGAYNQEIKQIISLDEIAKAGFDSQTKIYQDVNIPVSTKHFLFYGEADGTKDGTKMGKTDNAFDQGVLLNTLNDGATSSIDKINFNLLKITSKNDFASSAESGSAKAILDALKAVVGADDGKWKTYATNPDNSGNVLTKLYESFTSLKAGSAESVKIVLTDLQTALGKLDPASYTGSVDINKIIAAINGAINASDGTLKENTFPNDYNLPDGAVELTWSDDDVPSYTFTKVGNEGVTMGTMALKPENICYPASLSYFVSTPIKVTEDKSPQFPTSLTNWAGEDASWAATWTDAGTVKSTTTAIALTNPIQYAVANLKTVVICKNAVLEDNAQTFGGEEHPRKVTVPSEGFPVTGVLVGGQPKSVNWNFVPGSDEAEDRVLMVYDKAVPATVKAAAAANFNSAKANYTLVLDNRKTTGTLNDADVVNIAIELKNTTGTDFYGFDGIVKAGATFYLVGQLKTQNIDGNATSGTDDRKSVFEQDYTTTARLTIGSLAKAYNCIPDLRSTQLQLGLAVDLEWKSGIVFDVEL